MIDLLALHVDDRLARWLELADQLAARFCERAPKHDRAGTMPTENFVDLRAAGFHLLPVPQEYGGWGATLPEAVRVIERLARGDGATALVFDMHVQVVGSLAETRPWNDDRFARFCCEIVEHGALVNSAATEPELGSPSRGGLPKTTARKDGNVWRVTGRKSWASGAPVLSHFLIPAVLEDAPQGTVGVFLMAMDRPGVHFEETWDPLGMRGTGSHDLVLEAVPIDAQNLVVVREVGAPDPAKVSTGAWFSLTVGGVYLGIAQAARDVALQYAQARKPTALQGKSIATLEPIQRLTGQLEVELLTARALLYAVADAWAEQPEQRNHLVSYVGVAKATATQHAVNATDLALRIVGGQSMARSFPLERLFRDVRAGLFHPPTEDAAYGGVGKQILGG
jgi:alkylation response protein AidB-like acyl-CoA dehydrogenase